MSRHAVPDEERDRPTVKQVYALAAALCERMGEDFPETRGEASEVIERLRCENGDSRQARPEPARAGGFRSRKGRGRA